MNRTSRLLRLALCVLALGLLHPSPGVAAADAMDFYKTGLAARDAGNWEQVERMMQRAIELKPEAKRRRLLRRGSYFPHFYLGLARYRQGDCPGALASWAESERQGAIVGQDEYLQLLRLQTDCRENGTPSLAYDDPRPVAAPGGAQGEPREREAQESASEKEKPTIKERVRKGQLAVEQGGDPARKGLGAVERIAPEDSELGKAAGKGKAAVDLAEAGSEIVDRVLSPEERLEAAIDAYFAGKPRRTVELLEAADLSDPRARSQVYLFRAAASFRLYRLAGNDEALLETARENAARFREQPWSKDFPTELFDPSFVRLVQSGD